jgi:hypothetical protein
VSLYYAAINNRLEAVDLAFDLAGAPRGIYGRCDGGDVFLESIGEADERPEFANA